jgi:hypothetical protein
MKHTAVHHAAGTATAEDWNDNDNELAEALERLQSCVRLSCCLLWYQLHPLSYCATVTVRHKEGLLAVHPKGDTETEKVESAISFVFPQALLRHSYSHQKLLMLSVLLSTGKTPFLPFPFLPCCLVRSLAARHSTVS